MKIQDQFKKVSESLTFKLGGILLLLLILLIPKAFVFNVIDERQERSCEVKDEISSKWGYSQIISSPIFSFSSSYTENEITRTNSLNCFADKVSMNNQLAVSELNRSIYKVLTYKNESSLHAEFTVPRKDQYDLHEGSSFDIQNAVLNFGISDLNGIDQNVQITLKRESGETTLKALPNLRYQSGLKSGFHIKLPKDLKPGEKFSINAKINLRGSEGLRFVCNGNENFVSLQSSWPHPSFDGRTLPQKRDITAEGFKAEWRSHEFQRNLPQHWRDRDFDNQSSSEEQAFGVKLIETNSLYQQVTRTAKYALLFLGFTFIAIFISERVLRRKVHFLQYTLIGFAQLIFYLLLLSLAEQISFKLAYLISASMTALVLAAYAKAIFRSVKMASITAAIISFMYGILYCILQMEDHAMLLGSFTLFFILSIVMYCTRSVNEES